MKLLCDAARLANGSELHLLHDARGAMLLELRRAGQLTTSLAFAPRSAGLGGGRLVMAPSEKVAVISVYSGQSEEGFELVSLDPELRLVSTGRYTIGESASFAFCPHERRLAMVYPFACTEWWLGYDEGESVELPDGSMRFPFGEIRLLDLHDGAETRHVLDVLLPAGWQPPKSQWDSELRPRFITEQELEIGFPWGPGLVFLPTPPALEFPWRDS